MTGFDPRKYGSPLAKNKPQEGKTPSPLQLTKPAGEIHNPLNATTNNPLLVKETATPKEPPSDSQRTPNEQPDQHSTLMQPEIHTPAPPRVATEPQRPVALSQNKNIQNKIVRPGNMTSKIIMNNHPKPEQDKSPEERLKRVQKEAMERIGVRNRTKDSPHNKATTSLRALQLARQPVQDTQSYTEVAKPTSQSQPELGGKSSYPSPPLEKSVAENVSGSWESFNRLIDTETKNQDEQPADYSEGNISTHAPVKSIPFGKQITQKPLPEPLSANQTRTTKADLSGDSPGTSSGAQNDEDIQSDDSMKPMKHGKTVTDAKPSLPPHNLYGWDGKLQPPPVDWNDRPRFKSDHPETKNGFQNWSTEVIECYSLKDPEKQFECIPNEDLKNLDLSPDGIGMVPQTFKVDHLNVDRYYDVRDRNHACEITAEDESNLIPDGAENCKLDLREPRNAAIKDETTEALVQNWNAHVKARLAQDTPTPESGRSSKRNKPASVPLADDNNDTLKPPPRPKAWKPKANIYLRPAVKSDIPQITSLYNLHVLHSTRPADCTPISDDEMLNTYNDVKSDLLPFIIASTRNGTRDTIVGYASAMLLTSANQVERTTAELELYVHPDHMHLGIGTCLLDRILSVLDVTYTPPSGPLLKYPWHCDPRLSTKYSAGGLRNLHKLIFQVRSYTHPRRKPLTTSEKTHINFHYGLNGVDYSSKMTEADYPTWLKEWLVGKWGFEEQGVLKEVGTKRGRWVDTVYLSRMTGWGPREGQVPEFVEGVDGGRGAGTDSEGQ